MESFEWPVRNPVPVKPNNRNQVWLWIALTLCVVTIIVLDVRLESLGAQLRVTAAKLEACNTGTPMPQIVE